MHIHYFILCTFRCHNVIMIALCLCLFQDQSRFQRGPDQSQFTLHCMLLCVCVWVCVCVRVLVFASVGNVLSDANRLDPKNFKIKQSQLL